MLREELRERLAAAGKKFDGHVTEGSLNAQMEVVLEALTAACPAFYRDENKPSAMEVITKILNDPNFVTKAIEKAGIGRKKTNE